MCDPHCRTQLGFQGLIQKEWVTGGHRFCNRFNYHRDSDKDEAPVFLLFLDCVWQLWAQFPSRFQLTEDFLLALHDSVHLPLFSTFLANSQRERLKRTQHLSQSYTRVEGWRDQTFDPGDSCDPPLPAVWDWVLQYSKERQAAFTQPVACSGPAPPLLNGNLNTSTDTLRIADTIPGSVFLLSRGSFSCPPHLPPWRSGNGSGMYRKSHRRALSSEHVPGLERLLKAWALAEFPHSFISHLGPQGPLDSYEPLLPLLMGPCMGLWRQCYLRGAIHAQAFSHPLSAPQPHPVERLSQEVMQLRTRLAQVSCSKEPPSPNDTLGSGVRLMHPNLNHNANNSTFLFPKASTKQLTANVSPHTCPTNQKTANASPHTHPINQLTANASPHTCSTNQLTANASPHIQSTNQQTSINQPSANALPHIHPTNCPSSQRAPTALLSWSPHRSGNKQQSFLFGSPSPAEAQTEEHPRAPHTKIKP